MNLRDIFMLFSNLFANAVRLNFWSSMRPRYVICLQKCVLVLLMVVVFCVSILPGRLRFLKAQGLCFVCVYCDSPFVGPCGEVVECCLYMVY